MKIHSALTKIIFLILILSPIAPVHAAIVSKIVTKTIEYKDGDTILEGIVAYDSAIKTKRPGIVVVHEWTGLGSYVKSRIEMLAKLGYVAFAADIYGKGIRPNNPKDAATTADLYKSNRPLMRKRVALAVEEIKKQSLTNPNELAAIGYCFGGTTILELARSGADLKGFVSFHGGLSTPTPNDAKNIKGEILAFAGADDPYVQLPEVEGFEKEMRDNHVAHWELIKFGNAVHSFTNPEAGSDNSKGQAYNKEADEKSWEATQNFFKHIFKS